MWLAWLKVAAVKDFFIDNYPVILLGELFLTILYFYLILKVKKVEIQLAFVASLISAYVCMYEATSLFWEELLKVWILSFLQGTY